ncbi:ABC transporter ATP-binding protein [Mesorhizobium loti]|uniref:ABC transporter ATP-binding protein n=1 Tax=Rhizobium loti TaxID=381 RepID=UPI0009E30CC9|nr:ABC transporter ATP-binding protein [Mesorhizobium loti]
MNEQPSALAGHLDAGQRPPQDAQAQPAHDAAAAPIVQFRDVSKTYDGLGNVIDRLNLDIGRGEFLTLLGPSGSGKTTLLMMLAGFENPTEGDLLLDGRSLDHTPAHRRNMGIVFQSYALFPHMSVRRNIGYPLLQRGMAKAEIARRVDEALRMIHLDGFGERLPAQLSGGQQQRVALARALVFRPDIVLMDEPLGALDKQLREEMQIEIKHLHAALGVTVLYVTHDQSEALTLSDRIAVLDKGVILQVGTPEQIYETPNSSFVANFIGEMNNFPGTVREDEGVCMVELDCGVTVQATNAIAAKPGMRVNVAVRPEQTILSQPKADDTGAIPATVRSKIYHGDHLRYEIEVDGCADIMARTTVAAPERLSVGARVALRWAAGSARVLDARQAR